MINEPKYQISFINIIQDCVRVCGLTQTAYDCLFQNKIVFCNFAMIGVRAPNSSRSPRDGQPGREAEPFAREANLWIWESILQRGHHITTHIFTLKYFSFQVFHFYSDHLSPLLLPPP